MPRRLNKPVPDSWERARMKHYGAGQGNRHVRYGQILGGCSHCFAAWAGPICRTTGCLGNLEPRYVKAVEKGRYREAENLRVRIERARKASRRAIDHGGRQTVNLRVIRGGVTSGATSSEDRQGVDDRRAA